MGRAPGAKNKPKEESEVVVSEVNGNVIPAVQELNQTAIGRERLEKDGQLRYVVYEVKFDLVKLLELTKQNKGAASVTIIEDCPDSDNAIHRLRVEMARYL